MFYFAYGSNMSHEQMKERCPDSRFVGRAFLPEYSFMYDGYSERRGGAVGNVAPSKNSVVWGGIFEISEKDLESLDRLEGYPHVYGRQKLPVKDDSGASHQAWIYLRPAQKCGAPSHPYRKIILTGARDCDLPEDYVRQYL